MTPPRAAAPPLEALTGLELPLPRHRGGKVREVFEAGGRLLLVATDRISAFDCVFARGIPGKGAVLTGVSRFWFDRVGAARDGLPAVRHHLLSADARRIVEDLGLPAGSLPLLSGRTLLVRKAEPIPVECVVRGYLDGSALAEYARGGRVAGVKLPPGLRRGDRLRRPLFTPARKAAAGHDENVAFEAVVASLGPELAETLRDLSLRLYEAGAAALEARGLLLADTKFEFGLLPEREARAEAAARAGGASGEAAVRDRLLLIDEVLTPDSSRIWEASAWEPGRAQPSFDKQPLRDYLEALAAASRWDKRPPAPELPDEVVRETARRYAEAHLRITGEPVGAREEAR